MQFVYCKSLVWSIVIVNFGSQRSWLNSGNYKPTNQNGPFEKQTKAWRAAISKQPIRIGFDGRDGNQNKAGRSPYFDYFEKNVTKLKLLFSSFFSRRLQLGISLVTIMASGTFKPSGLVRKLLFSKYETFYGYIRFQGFE